MVFLDSFGDDTEISFEDLFGLFDEVTIGYDGDTISVLDGGITNAKIVSVSANKITGSFPNILDLGDLNMTSKTGSSALYLDSSKNIQSATLTNGQLLIGSTGNDPVKAVLTSAGGTVTITNGLGSINLEAVAPIAPIYTHITLSDASNQIRSHGISYTVPNVIASDFLMNKGDQDIIGLKTWFDILRIFGHNYIQFGNLGRGDNNTQILLKYPPAGGDYSIDFADSAISHAYTIPDTGVNSGIFIMDRGNQTINSIKTFLSEIILGKASGQLIIQPGGSGFKFTIDCTNPSANRTYTLIDSGANSQFVMTDGSQPLNDKTFTNCSTTDDFTIGGDLEVVGNFTGKNIELDHDDSSAIPNQIEIDGTTDGLKRLHIGLNTTSNYGAIDAERNGVGYPLFLNPTGGIVLVNNTNSYTSPTNSTNGKLIIYGSGTSDTACDILHIRENTDTNPKEIFMGYNTSGNYGVIQAVHHNVAYKDLYLNPNGGSVLIGTAGAKFINSTSGYTGAPLKGYEEATSANINFTGAYTKTYAWTFSKFGRVVTAEWPDMNFTTTAGATIVAAAGQIPARFRPTKTTRVSVVGQDNGANLATPVGLDILADGSLFIYKNALVTAFTNGAVAGPYGSSITYTCPSA